MEIRGKVKQLLEEIKGETSRGSWRKQGVVIEVPGNFPKSVCVDIWGDNIDAFALKADEEVVAQIDIESREYNGKWFTNVKAWRVDRPAAEGSQSAPSTATTTTAATGDSPYADMSEGEDDLPF